MPTRHAARLAAVAPSATIEMAARAAKLRAEGHRVLAFSLGEPDFDTPRHIREAARAALEAGATRYTPVLGTPELRRAICEASARDRGYRPEPDQIAVTCGAKHALYELAVALYDPGDEVVIPAPYWVSYPEQVRLVGAVPVVVPTSEAESFRLSPAALERALSPRTKAILLCSPSNPTGAAYGRAELTALLDVVRRHDCWIIVDEIYGQLVYGGFEHVSVAALAPDLRDRTVIVDGVSKTYAMTGWRIGWSIAPAPLTRVLDVVQGQVTSNAAAVSQAAALAALNGPRDDVRAMRDEFERRRARMVEGLGTLPGVRCRMPEGAFYAFADVRGLYGLPWPERGRATESDEDVALWLLERAHVAAVAGTPFGAPGFLRFSYACSVADIDEGISRIRAALAAARA